MNQQQMYRGTDVPQLMAELGRQKQYRKDEIIKSGNIFATKGMVTVHEELFDGENTEIVTREEPALKLMLRMESGTETLPLTDWAHRQLGEKCGIPHKYYEKMRQGNRLRLLGENVNEWIETKDKRMVRMLDGNIRAILSDRYKIMDNSDIGWLALEKFKEHSALIQRCDITEERMYMKAIMPHMISEIRAGDTMVQGIVLSNSEVGSGSLKIEPFILRQVCTNGMIGPHSMARVHLGSSQEIGIISDETKDLESQAIWSKCKDVIDATFTEEIFESWCDQIRAGTEVEIESPTSAVGNVVKQYKLREGEKNGILDHFAKEGDSTQYGMVNAVTRVAQDANDYSRQVELEGIGGELSILDGVSFRKMIERTIAV